MPDVHRPPSPHSGIAIRRAVSTDIADLLALESDRFASDRLSRRSLAALARSPSAILLVAEEPGGACLGYALALTRRGSRGARLYSIAVSSDAGGRGIGAMLLAAIEDAARARGLARLHLEVRADNLPGIRLYERSGYLAAGERLGYYADGMDARVYARTLSDALPTTPRRAA